MMKGVEVALEVQFRLLQICLTVSQRWIAFRSFPHPIPALNSFRNSHVSDIILCTLSVALNYGEWFLNAETGKLPMESIQVVLEELRKKGEWKISADLLAASPGSVLVPWAWMCSCLKMLGCFTTAIGTFLCSLVISGVFIFGTTFFHFIGSQIAVLGVGELGPKELEGFLGLLIHYFCSTTENRSLWGIHVNTASWLEHSKVANWAQSPARGW